MVMTITLRIKTDDPRMIDDLVHAWLNKDGAATISVPAGRDPRPVQITYVRERD